MGADHAHLEDPQKKPDAKGRQDAGKGRRDSQVGGQVSGVQRGPPPEEVLSNARARVSKLEAAMAAVGDPTYVGLQDALKKAKAQAQVRPVAERIASSKVFIERAKKRIIAGREEVSRAQEVLTTAQAHLLTEERGLADAEARLATLFIEESNGVATPVGRQVVVKKGRGRGNTGI